MLVGSRGEYCCRIFYVSPVSLLAFWMSWARLRLCCFLYLSRVCCTRIFILADVAMGSKWSSSLGSTRPPNESTRFVLVGARRVFASTKNTCYLPSRRPCFSRLFHSGHIVPGGLMVEAVSEALSGGNCGCFPLVGFWRDGIVFVAKCIRDLRCS